jgi:hypothetical protein
MIRLWTAIDPRLRIAAAAVIIALVLPLAWYLGSPLFLNVTVNERFPDVAPAVAPTSAPTAIALATIVPAAMTKPSAGAVGSIAPTAMTAAMTEPTAGAMSSTAPPAVPAPAAPLALGSGQFTEVDSVHTGEGTATVYQLADGRRILRFEPFKVQNGPDLYVYLSGHPMPRSSAQLHEQGALEVARLKGNLGDQNYELPADLDLAQYRSVVIYCKRFSVIFSTAELVAPPQ